MKIFVITSLTFSQQVGDIKNKLEKKGHQVDVPFSVGRVLKGDLAVADIEHSKSDGTFNDYTRQNDLMRWNMDQVAQADAVLVLNMAKNGEKNYIGGNAFLEMGHAYYLKKPIFLWNDIPENKYYGDELKVMAPKVINQNIDLI